MLLYHDKESPKHEAMGYTDVEYQIIHVQSTHSYVYMQPTWHSD
jgi:hypothetical protein